MTRGLPLPAALQLSHSRGVLLPMHLQIQGAESVTIDLARVTVPESPPVAVLPLSHSMDSLKAKKTVVLFPQ